MRKIILLFGVVSLLVGIIGLYDIEQLFTSLIGIGVAFILIGLIENKKEKKER